MKCVVMETNGRNAVVMNDAGDFMKVRNRNYEPGQRIVIHEPRFRRFRIAASATIGALALFAAGGAYAYAMPYSEVSLDINPSIVMKLNCFNRVVAVTPMNDDAQKIVENLELINDDIDTATGEVVDELSAQGYIDSENDAEIMVAVVSNDQKRAEEMLETAEKKIEQKTKQNSAKASVFGECVGQELVTKAREYDVSPGKLMLVEKYAISTGDPASVDVTEWLDKSVKEIMAATNENKKAAKGMDPAGNNSNGKGNGGDTEATASPGATDEAASTANKNGNGHQKASPTAKANVNSNENKNNGKRQNSVNHGKPTATPRVSVGPTHTPGDVSE